MGDKNKIDAAIDEVLESKRLKQGAEGFAKIAKVAIAIGALGFVLFLIGEVLFHLNGY